MRPGGGAMAAALGQRGAASTAHGQDTPLSAGSSSSAPRRARAVPRAAARAAAQVAGPRDLGRGHRGQGAPDGHTAAGCAAHRPSAVS